MANTEKLEELAEVLEIADYFDSFYMGSWATIKELEENPFPARIPQMDCGFTACAAGWALLLDGWEMVNDSIFYKEEQKLVNETMIGVKAAEILDLDPPWEDGETNDAHLFFWTNLGNKEVVEGIKYLAKGEDMDMAYWLAQGYNRESFDSFYEEDDE